MSLFSADRGIVLEGKHLFGDQITPVEGAVRNAIGKMVHDIFPDRSVIKYLHRGYGEYGIGTYTLQFSKEATVNHEQFAVVVRHVTTEGDGDYIEAQLLLDGKDWNLDTIRMGGNNPLARHSFYVELPEFIERDNINRNDATFRPYVDFAEEFEEKMDSLGEYIVQNLVMEGEK